MSKRPSVESPQPKRRKLDPATDAAPSSDGGSDFNRNILATCAKGGLVEGLALSDWHVFTLLLAILKNDKDMQDGFTVPEIMHKHPELLFQLQDAWKSKRFEEIRRLPFLQAPKVSQDQGGKGCRPETVSDSIRKAWELPYRGQAHKHLYDSLCEMRAPKGAPYQNIVTIIQSSGYGKSRMLDEHAKLVFTFPFVVRNPLETRVGSAYPHPDERVHKFLTTFGNTEEEAIAGYCKFFSYLFTSALSIIGESHRSQSLPEWWRSYLAIPDNRQRLYSQAVNFAESSITTELLTQSSSAGSMPPSSSQSEVKKGDNQPGLDVANAVERLLKEIPIPTSKKKAVKAAIYFDEAHELSTYHVGPKQRNRLEVLYSCLDVFLPFPLMFIFTSTASSIHRSASPQAMARSSRRVISNSVDHTPFTELPFDCHHSFPLKPDNYPFEDICELKFLANFGRPLFWSLLESGDNEGHVLDLAMDKLASANSDPIYRSSDRLPLVPTYSLTATIDLLLMLDYNSDHQTVQDVQKVLVASHMRTCMSIQSDCEYIRSCYPSEPFLAEAAMAKLAQMVHPEPDVTHPDTVIDVVNAHFSQGLLHSGDRGKLAARMLLMNAYMSGCEKGGSGEEVIYSKGCKLNDFLQCLFHRSDQVLEAKPDNILDGPTLENAFKDAVVRFTHFGKFVDDIATSQHAAHAAFFRSMAIVCHDTQESVDIIIPVLSATNGAVCRHVITSILIHIKRSVRPGSPSLLAIDQSKLGFFPENTICKCGRQPRNTPLNLPYISFVLDLGMGERRTYAMPIPTSTPQMTARKHNRYVIYTRGLSMYRSVTPYNLGKYQRLLRFGDHAHQSSSHLSMVRALKPFWAGGDAFAWLEDEALTGHPVPKEADTLEVGKYRGEHDT